MSQQQSIMEAGRLTIILERAENLKDVEIFGKQDPFCLLQVGNSPAQRSKTHWDGGKSPVWNQTFTFDVTDEGDFIIEVRDKVKMSIIETRSRQEVS
jgi:Ca2+-dependent lipid-binding protein